MYLLSNGLGGKGLAVPAPILASTILQVVSANGAGILLDLITLVGKQGEELELAKSRLSAIHVGFAVGIFSTLIDRAKTPNPSKTLQNTIDAYGKYGQLITLANKIGGASRKTSILAYIFANLIGHVGDALDIAQLVSELIDYDETDFGNFIMTLAYGFTAGLIPNVLENNKFVSNKAPKSAIKIYAPIIWLTAFAHLFLAIILELI